MLFKIQFLKVAIVVAAAVWLDFESNLNRSSSFGPRMLMTMSADCDVINSGHLVLESKA